MTFRRSTKRATILSLFLGILLAGSVAFAWWTATGSGTGYASADSVVAVDTLSTNVIGVNDLYPGGTGVFKIEIRNQNPFPVDVTAINATGAPYTVPTDAVCDASASVTWAGDIDLSGTPLTIPANSTSGVVSYPAQVDMDGPSAVDACQGETFAVDVQLVATTG